MLGGDSGTAHGQPTPFRPFQLLLHHLLLSSLSRHFICIFTAHIVRMLRGVFPSSKALIISTVLSFINGWFKLLTVWVVFKVFFVNGRINSLDCPDKTPLSRWLSAPADNCEALASGDWRMIAGL